MTRRRNGREWKEKYLKWILWCCRVSPRLLRTLSVSPPNLYKLHASISISCMFIVSVVAACMCLWLPSSWFSASASVFGLHPSHSLEHHNALSEFPQIWHRHPLELENELITVECGLLGQNFTQISCSLRKKLYAKTLFLDVNINTLTAIAEGEIVTIFHIWWDTELVTLILGAHLEAAASFQQHPYFKHCLLSWRQLCTLSESALMAKQACEHVKRLWLFLFLSVNLLITFYTLTDIQQ